MWKKTFIRLLFVMMVFSIGLLVVAASNKKATPINTECTASEEKCAESQKIQDEFRIWESVSRSVLSAVQF